VPENIVDGVTIFGVEGTYTGELEWSTAQPSANWATAVSTWADLTQGGATAGDWRLPTITELLAGISDDWIIDGSGVRFLEGNFYVSSTEDGADSTSVWGAQWFGSLEHYVDFKTSSFSVLCVR